MFKRLLKNESGSALLMALIGLGVISILTMAAIFMSDANTKQTHREGKRTQAYYVADAGAKSLIKHLKDESKYPPDKLKQELDKIVGMGKIPGEYKDMEFEIEVTEDPDKVNQYEIKSTGIVDGIEDGTIAILKIGRATIENSWGDGAIYITDTGSNMLQIPKLSQLKGTNLKIYTKNKKVVQLEGDTIKGYKVITHKKDSITIGETYEKGDHTVDFEYNMEKEFPIVKYSLPKGEKETKVATSGSGDLKLEGKRYVRLDVKPEKQLNIGENKTLNIYTSGNTEIDLREGFHMDEGSKFNIHANGVVNIYLDAKCQADGGAINVIPDGSNTQVNFYVGENFMFDMQDSVKITGINLYAPKSFVEFTDNVYWKGIIIAKELQISDKAKFEAPSISSSSSDVPNENIWILEEPEWKEWGK